MSSQKFTALLFAPITWLGKLGGSTRAVEAAVTLIRWLWRTIFAVIWIFEFIKGACISQHLPVYLLEPQAFHVYYKPTVEWSFVNTMYCTNLLSKRHRKLKYGPIMTKLSLLLFKARSNFVAQARLKLQIALPPLHQCRS